MILIISPNSAIDYYVEGTNNVGETNRVNNYNIIVGGKGINVAKSFKALNKDAKIMTFLSGFTGDYIKNYLEQENINFDYCEIEDTNTRINFKLKSGKVETEFNGAGVKLNDAQFDEFISKIKSVIEQGDVEHILLCGTNAQSSRNLFEEVAKLANANKIKFSLDANNDDILKLAKYEPFIIKPNLDEFGNLFDMKIKYDDYETIKEKVYYLNVKGIKNILLSLGSKGAIFINDDNFIHKKIKVKHFISTVAAGDTMLSGFIYKYLKDEEFLGAFDFSVMLSAKKITQVDFVSEEDAYSLLGELERVK